MYLRLILFSVAALTLLSNPHAQDAESSQGEAQRERVVPYVSLSLGELSLMQYRPNYVRARDLADVVRDMMGRSLIVQERGSAARPIKNISELGGQVIIYDTKEYANQVMAALKSLDKAPETPAMGEAEEGHREEMVEYTPRNVGVSEIGSALRSFGNLQYSEVGNRMITARVTKSRLPELKAYFERIDQPDPCVMLTCYLLQGSGDGTMESGPQPPAGVISNLNAILPGMKFRSIGFSLVQASVSTNRAVELSIKGSDNRSYDLKFMPLAFDKRNGDMTVQNCEVVATEEGNLNGQAGPGRSQLLLRTDTVFRGAEYTVLGASGQDPVFIVVHSRMVP